MILEELRREARKELEAKNKFRDPLKIDLFGIEDEVEDLAKRRLNLQSGVSSLEENNFIDSDWLKKI